MSKSKSKRSRARLPRRRLSKPGRSGHPVTRQIVAGDGAAHEQSASPLPTVDAIGAQLARERDLLRQLTVPKPVVTLVEHMNTTVLYVNGEQRFLVERVVGDEWKRVARYIEQAGGCTLVVRELHDLKF